MKIYNIIGYFIIALYGLACVFFAPENIGPLGSLAIGAVYLILFWFLAGVYLADILHLLSRTGHLISNLGLSNR